MAYHEIKKADGWLNVAVDLETTLVADQTINIGTDDTIRIYAKATEPSVNEGFIVDRGTVAYTHKNGVNLYVKAVTGVARIVF